MADSGAEPRRRAKASEPEPRKQAIRHRALALGFDAIGFAPASLSVAVQGRLREFLAASRHGGMAWLARHEDRRADPDTLWPEARTVIAVGLSYAPTADPLAALDHPECGSISVYARGRDYHDVLKGKLKNLAGFIAARFAADVKVFVDTAPVMEKPLAMQAGLGWQGKHTNLVSRRHGSWLFLGEIYTTLALTPDLPHEDRCGTCRRCLEACPTRAFPAPYKLDARRCISYLTIEHPGPIPEEFRPLIGNRIYGCDDCLAVCPWNRFAAAGREAKLAARDDLARPPLATLAALDDAGFRARFAGSPIKRIGRNRFVRNVLIAIGNSRQSHLAPAARTLLSDPDPVVADAARWALERLAGRSRQKRI
ncbi:MAG: tRNA epoxyqueuosine(34) reductase QueG [Acetobacteraceae bacterium]